MWAQIKNNDFKTIVFDLNGTITGRVSDHPSHIQYRNHYIKTHTNISNFELLPISTTTALKACGLDPIKYYHQRNKELNWADFHSYNENVFSNLSLLRKAGLKLVLYTDCYAIQVSETLKLLNLESVFDLCITSEFNMKKPSPKAYGYIAKVSQCKPNEIVVVGNDYVMDLLPLLLMGGNVIKVDSVCELQEVTNFVLTRARRIAS